MKMYELASEIERWSDVLADGMTDDAALATLGEMKIEFNQKMGYLGRLIRNLEGDADAIAAEQKRLAEKKITISNRIEALKRFIGCIIGEGTKWTDGVITYGWRKSQSVQVNEADLPAKYWKTKVVKTPDKESLAVLLDAGEVIAGAELIKKQNLQVR